jgi:mRNA interferase HigB
MRIISRKKLRDFWERHPDAEHALQTWYADVANANWKAPSDVRSVYRNASFLADNRIVFNIKGNKYRLITAIRYEYGIVYIRFVGSHADYDRIDVLTI